MSFLPVVISLLIAGAALADTIVPTPPDDAREIARSARESFEQGRYSDTEKLYEQMVTSHPDDVYALSNLGVVLFRLGKWGAAERALQRAVAVAPGDSFSHCTLGIVYYQERFYDRATVELSKALAIDPYSVSARKTLNIIRNEPRPTVTPVPVGDFDTSHERRLRQAQDSTAPPVAGEIGLSPSTDR